MGNWWSTAVGLHKTTAPLREMESVWRKLLVLTEFPWNAMRNLMGIQTPCSGWIELTLTGRLNSQIQWIYHGTDDVNMYCCTILPDHQAYCDLYFLVNQVIFIIILFFSIIIITVHIWHILLWCLLNIRRCSWLVQSSINFVLDAS